MVNAFNRLKPRAKRNMSKTLKNIQYFLSGLINALCVWVSNGDFDDILLESQTGALVGQTLDWITKVNYWVELSEVCVCTVLCHQEIFQCLTEYNAILRKFHTHTHNCTMARLWRHWVFCCELYSIRIPHTNTLARKIHICVVFFFINKN